MRVFFHSGWLGKDVNPPGNPEKIFLSRTALIICHSEKMIAPWVQRINESGFP
jgi:hypothetical protein